jgi:imidazolonepropionase-like amidohydrolase
MFKFKVIVFLSLLQLSAFAQKNQVILLKNATIIDGDSGVNPYHGDVLIVNGKIELTGGLDIKGIKWKPRVIDCTGKFITPGLIDAHVHLATADLRDLKSARSTTDSIIKNLLVHGITTVRDMAGDARYLASYKEAINKGRVVGPDIYYAAQFAGPGYFEMMSNGRKGQGDLGNTAWYRAIRNKADVKPAIAAAKKAGVTGIKIYANLSKELIREITDEAHKQGLLAWAHAAIFPSKPMDVAQSGVNSMSHANDLVFQQIKGDTIEIGAAWAQLYKGLKLDSGLRDQMLLEMKKQGTYLDPTIFHAENNKMVNAVLITRRAHMLGVKIVTGTDWVYPTKNESVPLLEEMKLLAGKCGLSNLQIVESATLNGALVTGLKDRGVIRAGMRADLLILNQDPLKDLNAFDKPDAVVRNGVMLEIQK